MRYFFVCIVTASLYAEALWHPQLGSYADEALDHLRRYQQENRWHTFEFNATIQASSSHPLMDHLKQQLILEGDIDPKFLSIPKSTLDKVMIKGIKRYQKRHGLHETGIIDHATSRELGISLESRIALLELNKKRVRGIVTPLSGWLVVNIPSATLDLVKNNHSIADMKTVVGKPKRQTPLFDRRVVHGVVFNPSWTMPETVIKEDMTKKILHHADLFSEKNITVYQGNKKIDPKMVEWKELSGEELLHYRYVQNYGVDNPLGRIKFLFSNTKSIYLHDTSRPELFKQAHRFESSGCIRLEKPEVLQEYILGKEYIPPVGEPDVTLPVNKSLVISVIYLTSWVDTKKRVHFRPDIYGYDACIALPQGEAVISSSR